MAQATRSGPNHPRFDRIFWLTEGIDPDPDCAGTGAGSTNANKIVEHR